MVGAELGSAPTDASGSFSVSIGSYAGPIVLRASGGSYTDEATGALTARGQAIIDHTPMGRFGAPEDLLGAVLWLLSPASAFVTGTVVAIDGAGNRSLPSAGATITVGSKTPRK